MSSSYALGHSDGELRRLATQARLIDPITARYFRAAGVTQGMRVLDIGSGAGDVAVLLAQIVGATGEVVGTDRSQAALDVARTRVAALGLRNVTFLHGDPSEMAFDARFDAVAGRYVLQFVPEPARFLRLLMRHLGPGGIVVFHELDWGGARSWPPVSAYDACCRWCAATIRAKGAAIDLGARLARVFSDAGLGGIETRLEAAIGQGAASNDVVHLVTDLMETLAEDTVRFGVAKEGQIALPTLHDRILGEVIAADATTIGRAEVGAWARLAAAGR